MIGRLQGKVVGKGLDWVLIDIGGVGYKIFVLPSVAQEIKDKEAVIFTHLYVREDNLSLYGFLNEEQLELFELLISVSGIGPKAALGVLSIGDVKSLKQAIVEGRSDLLMGVSGVGRKMADRMVLELKNRVQVEGGAVLPQSLTAEDEEVVQALENLGYKKSEASQAVAKAGENLKPEEKIKEALRYLGK